MTQPPPVCVWCLMPASDPIHQSHPFTGPRVELHLSPRDLARLVASELRHVARETLGPTASAADALDILA